MAGERQSALERTAQYQSPWHERLPNGELGKPYGPSPSTLARRIAEYREWSWRPEKYADKFNKERELLAEWLEKAGGNEQLTEREHDVYNFLYIQGLSSRKAAARLGINRRSLREYKRRLLGRMEQSAYEQRTGI